MKILVRSPNWLGDAVIATTVPTALKQAYPEATVAVLAHPRVEEVWRHHPAVEEVIKFEGSGWVMATRLRNQRYDVGVVIPHSFSSAWWMKCSGVSRRIGYATEGRRWLLTDPLALKDYRERHEVDEYLGLVERLQPSPLRERSVASEYGREPILVTTHEERQEARVWLGRHEVEEEALVVALCPGATYGPAKRWPADRFIEVGRQLRARVKVHLVVIGNEAESLLVSLICKGIGEGAMALTGQSLRHVAAILQVCKVAVSNDTGLMHLAAAVRVPTVAIFGSTSPRWTAPLGDAHHVVYKAVPCSPCFQRTCIRREKDYLCLQEISPEEVIGAVVSQIAGLQLG